MLSNALKWIGTVGGVSGAFLLAANVPVSGWGYVPFLMGALALVGWGVLIKEPAIWLLNGVFCMANLVGIWRWLLSPG